MVVPGSASGFLDVSAEPMVDQMQNKKTVFLVDDDPAVRHALGVFLESTGYAVIPFSSAEDYLESPDHAGNGVLVVDQRMKDMSGLELQEELNRRGREIPVIFITGHGDISMSVTAMRQGAMNFLEKPFSNKMLLESIQEAFRRAKLDQEERTRKEAVEARCALLTLREREVMVYVSMGMSNRAIAERLGVSNRTVEVHRSRVMAKLEAESLPDLVRMVDLCEIGKPLK
jgi:FixJ family two-component response regulator